MKSSEKTGKMFWLPELVLATLLFGYYSMRICYLVYKASVEKEDMLSFDLHPSWWFGRKMDDSDYEWRYWADYYSSNIQWYLAHTLVGLAINCHLEKGRIYANIAFSVVSLSYLLGLKQLTFLICNVCVVYLVVIISRRKLIVWAACLVILSLLHIPASSTFIMDLCYPDPSGTKYLALVYALSICNLRLVSFGVDVIDEYEKTGRLESFYRIVCYILYFPTFFSGPFISYKSFISNIVVKQEPLSWSRIRWILLESLLLMFWWTSMEILLHYLYCTALQQEEYFLVSADNWTVLSLCVVQAGLFNLKYMVLYGFPTLFAEMDGVTMPPRPTCLLVQHSASAIWRRFDVGLYNFIIRYLYIPAGGSKMGLSQQVLTMFLCFMFIGFWHGATAHIFIWVLVNFLAVFLENVHKLLLKTRHWKNIEIQFGDHVILHLEALLLAPIGILSLWSMFVFLGGKNVGFNLYKKLLKNAELETHVTILVLAYVYVVFSKGLLSGALLEPIAGLVKTRRNSNPSNEISKKSKHKHY